MPNKVEGDFSRYPEPIREVFPYLYGEACELRQCWEVYRHLFISKQELTEVLAEYLGALLGTYQNLLQDEMFMRIGRLTDQDNPKQKNLSLWALVASCEKWNPNVADELRTRVRKLQTEADGVRYHRHKRLAHYDLPVSLGTAALPEVTYSRIRMVVEEIERLVNLVAHHACDTTIIFDALDHREITWTSEMTVYKAKAYDALVNAGTIPRDEWEKHAIT